MGSVFIFANIVIVDGALLTATGGAVVIVTLAYDVDEGCFETVADAIWLATFRRYMTQIVTRIWNDKWLIII